MSIQIVIPNAFSIIKLIIDVFGLTKLAHILYKRHKKKHRPVKANANHYKSSSNS